MPENTISIDVSGAPAHQRSAVWLVLKVFLSFAISILLMTPMTILFMNGDSTVPREIIGPYLVAASWGGLVFTFGLDVGSKRTSERRIQLSSYGVTLARAKQRVFARLHRPWWASPDLWALVSFSLAIIAPIIAIQNERAIEVALGGVTEFGYPRWDNTFPEAGGLLVGLAFLLNALRLYKRGLSLWAFSAPFLFWCVVVPMFLLLYFWGVWCVLMLASGHAERAFPPWRPGGMSKEDGKFLLVIFGFLPVGVLSAASLLPPVRRFYDRMRVRIGRLMEVMQLPSAKQTLARDKRMPVLYLRSFHADQAWVWDGVSGKDATTRRLEESVAAPLRELGPFVGIGKPGELAVSGAARAYYSDNEWRAAITDLMARAGFIVLVMGATEGLAWEVATIPSRNHTAKVIWVLPPDRTNAALLRQKLRDVFTQSPYEAAARGADFSQAMAVHAVDRDRLAVISSAKNTTGEYEAAIYTAVYGLTRHLIEPGDP